LGLSSFGSLLRGGELLTELFELMLELLGRPVGLTSLLGQSVPGLLPPPVILQVDSAGLHEGQQEGLSREDLSLEHLTERAAPQRDPFNPSPAGSQDWNPAG
jgi:hypothetical protein